jgi:hypothetical protein
MRRFALLVTVFALLQYSCSRQPEEEAAQKPAPAAQSQASATPPATPPTAAPVKASEAPPPTGGFLFTDITDYAGIKFKHFNDASPRKYLPETMGSGVAVFDYDNDGRPDIYLVNSARLKGARNPAVHGALYRNLGNLKFEDVTEKAGLARPIFGMGVAVGDYDNDGFTDLFVSGVDEDRLYRNLGNGRFEDVSDRMGLDSVGFSSSCAFLDYDRDGYLDLFVGRYVEWSRETDITCSFDGVHRVYCTPEAYQGQSSRLYKNLDGRKFKDVTRSAGIWQPDGKTLGVAIMDYNRDGWPDIAVANDTMRNFLFVNKRDGTFVEDGIMSGMAYSESGATRGGMGIDTADADRDGNQDILVGNFSQEMSAFYRGSPKGFFVDEAPQAGIGLPTLLTLAFGTLFIDYDSDGLLDVVIADGHIEPEINKSQKLQHYTQPTHVFRNEGNATFRRIEEPPASPLNEKLVGRGLASGDIDGDGDLDLVITQNGRTARLWRNNTPARAWIRVKLVGVQSNRTGYGAVVKAVSGAKTWSSTLVSGRSYLSACEPVVTLGLGDAKTLDRLEIVWPSGKTQIVPNPQLNKTITVKEG